MQNYWYTGKSLHIIGAKRAIVLWASAPASISFSNDKLNSLPGLYALAAPAAVFVFGGLLGSEVLLTDKGPVEGLRMPS